MTSALPGSSKVSRSNRSRVTNRPSSVEGVDGRTAAGRRFRDLCRALADDLGGEASLTQAEILTVRNAASITVAAEAMQGRILRGEPVDPDEMTRLANASARLLGALRTKRTARKPNAPSLAEYLETKRAKEVAGAGS
jgi:hypothetical protein